MSQIDNANYVIQEFTTINKPVERVEEGDNPLEATIYLKGGTEIKITGKLAVEVLKGDVLCITKKS